jgi:uncharacterized protein
MQDYRITKEMYLIPNKDGKTILYFPLAGLLIDADNSLMNLLDHFELKELERLSSAERQQFDYLIEKGIITKKIGTQQLFPEGEEDFPHKLTLFPTNDCNMECTYCYAMKNRSRHLVMDWVTIERAVEYYINLMHQRKRTVFNLELHGGGEPFYEWGLVQRMIDFIEKECVRNNFKLEAVSSTNGVLSRSQLKWVTEHFSFILVSFEVLPDIQNSQRPFINQRTSFQAVDETIRYFDEAGFSYGIRVTVTSQNEDLLKETIDYVLEHYKGRLVFFEPVNICGNNQSSGEINFKKFIENFISLESYAELNGVQIRYSGAEYEKLTSNFCYAGTAQFAITPEGYLTNCWEVTDMDHPLSDIFIFGQLKEKGQLEINADKYNYLRSLSVKNFAFCQNCFAKWHCAGDCLARLYNDGFENSRGNDRCLTNRELIAHRLLNRLK